MSDFLTRMAGLSRQRCANAQAERSEAELVREAEGAPCSLPLQLSKEGFDLIAEVKRRSPSEGRLASDALSPADQAEQYARGGATAISVLTEPEQFRGELADLVQVVGRVAGTPAMRKDFLSSPYQVVEARAAGASGVLLVAAMLAPAELRAMIEMAIGLGMFALVEAFDEADLDRCVPIVEDFEVTAGDGAVQLLIGVNCRNLRSLDVDFARFETMARRLPERIPWIAESGVLMPEDAAEVAMLGYRLALVGTALMRAAQPAKGAQALIAAGRRAAKS